MFYALKTSKPHVNVLRLADLNNVLGMRFIYEAINADKEEIAQKFEE